MQATSPVCRSNLAHYGCHISDEVHLSTSSKQQHTDKSRANHFLAWTKEISLKDDPCLPHHDIQARNYLLACYAVSLIRGETIQSKRVRHATMRNYIKAAVRLHTDRDLPSPHSGAPIDYITIVLKAVKKFEIQPNRREMIHDEMIYYLESIRSSYDPDSLEAALIDWIYLGRFVGYRSIEWCQTKQKDYHKIDHPNWEGPRSYAFIADDFQFYNALKQPIYDLADAATSDISYFTLRFRKQKNDRNYELIPYYKDVNNPEFCAVEAAFRIMQRAARLDTPAEEPVGVYLSKKGKYANQRCFITSKQVASILQSVAAKVFKLNDTDKALNKWTSHSIRVTACNLLHRQGFSDTYIQTRLRWRSNAFLDYLRNTLYTAAAHTKALHIPKNNLPDLTTGYNTVAHPSGGTVFINSSSGVPIPRYRRHEEIEQVLHAGAA